MMRRIGLAVLICTVILTRCNKCKPENIDTEVNTTIMPVTEELVGGGTQISSCCEYLFI